MNPRPPNVVANMSYKPEEKDLATAWGNDVPVVATPILLWLTEICAKRALQDSLQPGEICVGYAHDSRHVRPALRSPELDIVAQLVESNRPYVTFDVAVRQSGRVVLEGRHTRAIVRSAAFHERIAAATSPLPAADAAKMT